MRTVPTSLSVGLDWADGGGECGQPKPMHITRRTFILLSETLLDLANQQTVDWDMPPYHFLEGYSCVCEIELVSAHSCMLMRGLLNLQGQVPAHTNQLDLAQQSFGKVKAGRGKATSQTPVILCSGLAVVLGLDVSARDLLRYLFPRMGSYRRFLDLRRPVAFFCGEARRKRSKHGNAYRTDGNGA